LLVAGALSVLFWGSHKKASGDETSDKALEVANT
jgi:hypothetical protein